MVNVKTKSKKSDKVVTSGKQSPVTTVAAYLPGVPTVLTRYHEQNAFGQFAAILLRMLTDRKMGGSWRELGKKIRTESDWRQFWNAVRIAVMDSSRAARMPLRKAEYQRYSVIARRAHELAELVRGGDLDILVYELFSPEDMDILGIEGWQALEPLDRDEAARTLLAYWPSTPELLDRMAYNATVLSQRVMTSHRVIQRKTRDSRMSSFIRSLAGYFNSTLGSPLYGTLANITGVVLQKDCDKAMVKHAIKRTSTNRKL